MANRIQIPFSFNYPSGGNLVPAASVSVGVYIRNNDGSQGSPAPVYQNQSGSSQFSSLQTDAGGNVPGWVAEGTYKIVASAAGGFGGGSINFDALYGGGTAQIATAAVGPSQIQPNSIDVGQLTVAVGQSLLPAGVILDYCGASPPVGFLACDASIVSQATYPHLYNAIGTIWNTGGEGVGNFRLPDMRAAVAVGAGTASWGTTRTVGKYGTPSGGTYLGEETHVLLAAESGQNGSAGTGYQSNDHSHYTSGTTSTESVYHSHTTTLFIGSSANLQTWLGAGYGSWYAPGTSLGYYPASNQNQLHTHTWGAQSGGVSADHYHGMNARTADASHNTMPPFAVTTKIIKT